MNLKHWPLVELSAAEYASLLSRTEDDLSPYEEKAAEIIAAVRSEGDQAVARYTTMFDGEVDPTHLLVSKAEIEQGAASVPVEVKRALRTSIDNVTNFHRSQMPSPLDLVPVSPGVLAGDRVTPIPRVACYVPRGKGKFPSVAVMTAAPAVVAGVPEIVIVTPPGPDGEVDPATLFVAQELGISLVFRCGGVQSVAAVALGTETVPKCDKIVGPGSPWVVTAKRLLASEIDPGPAAGPSESIILADSTAKPMKVALDLINESEHGPDSSAFLVTDDESIAAEVDRLVPTIWDKMSQGRREFSQTVLTGGSGGVVLCETTDQAIQFCNDYAAEHLQVHSSDPFAYLDRIVHAGEVLLGEHSAISLGNFVLGPNAILPTGSSARNSSALSVHEYLKRISVAYVSSQAAFARLAPDAFALATYEGFEAHALAVGEMRDS